MNERSTRESIRRSVLAVVQPLYRGTFDGVTKLSAKLRDLVPFGNADRVQLASPYGFASSPRSGVFAYFLNLLGNSQAPVIVSHLDLNRPIPNDGETILYCLNADLTLSPIRFTLQPDGTMIAAATTIKLGSASAVNPVLLGTDLQALLSSMLADISSLSEKVSEHQHTGNLGYPTSPPVTASDFVTLKGSFDTLKRISRRRRRDPFSKSIRPSKEVRYGFEFFEISGRHRVERSNRTFTRRNAIPPAHRFLYFVRHGDRVRNHGPRRALFIDRDRDWNDRRRLSTEYDASHRRPGALHSCACRDRGDFVNIINEQGDYDYVEGTKTLKESDHPVYQARIELGLGVGTWLYAPAAGPHARAARKV